MDKKIYFYDYEKQVIDKGVPQCYRSWVATEQAVYAGEIEIHTLQMGYLTYSALLFDMGYRIFISDALGEFELTLGNCARTNREIRYAHNHFKMWVSGEFTNLEKETNGPMVVRKETL